MRRPPAAAGPTAAAALLCAAAGCAGSGNAAAVRGDLLRTQDDLARTEAELRTVRADLAAAVRTADRLRDDLAAGGAVVAELPERARALGRVESVTVSKLLTGGLDRDGEPGDELLAVNLAPADADGAAVKAPGSVTLELLDLSADGPGRTVGSWAFDAAQAADRWRDTLVGAGYRFRLPLDPGAGGGENLQLHARFETPDGRRFDATHPVRVRRSAGPPAVADRAEPLFEDVGAF